MQLSPSDQLLIVERSARMTERFGGEFIPTAGNEALANQHLTRWKQHINENDPERFATHLMALGASHLTDAELLPLLGPIRCRPGHPIPRWTLLLGRLVEAISNFDPAESSLGSMNRCRTGNRHIPFEQLYWRIANFAWTCVEQAQPRADELLKLRARRGLQQYLLRRLSHIASPALHSMFLVHKSFTQSGMRQHLFGGATTTERVKAGKRYHASFIAEQGEDGLRTFFMRFPVAARLVAEITQLWIEFAGEFLTRLENDLHGLTGAFNRDVSLGSVMAISAGVSDPHCGGRTVLILTFQGGLRLVYKPRHMQTDRIFFELLGELNRREIAPALRVLKIKDQGEYGWMEFAEHEPCKNARATRRYYRRAGALACLVSCLHGMDFHRENVVAAGEYPVLVDLECLVHPSQLEGLTPPSAASIESAMHCVLRTGLIPLWQARLSDSGWYENSGFDAPIRQRGLFPSRRWMNPNADHVHVARASRQQHHAAHRPMLGNRHCSLSAHEKQFLEGYRQVAQALEGHFAPQFSQWYARVANCVRRRIKRPTLIYAVLLRRSLEPGQLRDGVTRSITLSALPCTPGQEQEWAEEIGSLERLDVPYFRLSPTESVDGWLPQHPPTRQMPVVKLAVRRKLALRFGKVHSLDELNKPNRERQAPVITPSSK